MHWDSKRIKRRAFDSVFKKGWRSWLMLVCISFIFSFMGIMFAAQTSFIDSIDVYINGEKNFQPVKIDELNDYFSNTKIVKNLSFLDSKSTRLILSTCSKSAVWVIKLFELNLAYINRNPGEVIVVLMLATVLATTVRFLAQNTLIIGANRAFMENRFSKTVGIQRVIAPFHLHDLPNLIWVMLRLQLALLLWMFTIVGGIYKLYQYMFIPYILAENPSVKWKQAKQLSKEMTKGYKFKMFKTQISLFYVWVLMLIPIVGLLVAVPFYQQLEAEFYFALRSRKEHKDIFIEKAFDGNPYTEAHGDPRYVLEDLRFRRHGEKEKSSYLATDYIIMFFVFSMIGWLWECGLYLVRDHVLVNRGALYGPWVPIYGIGGVAMIMLLNKFKESKIKVFVLGVLLCAVLEYTSSFILDFLFNKYYWNYKTDFANVNGRIYLAGLIGFGIGGLAGVYICAPAVSGIASKFPKKNRIIACAVLTAFFAADIIIGALIGFNSGEGVGGNL